MLFVLKLLKQTFESTSGHDNFRLTGGQLLVETCFGEVTGHPHRPVALQQTQLIRLHVGVGSTL